MKTANGEKALNVAGHRKRWALFTHHLGDYMQRWILKTPWGQIRLHRILRSDADRFMHDHPFDFTSFLLTGGYTEITPISTSKLIGQAKFWPRFSLVRKKAEDLHRLVLDKPVWTLVFGGLKRRDWGFFTDKGWVGWEEYQNKNPEHAW